MEREHLLFRRQVGLPAFTPFAWSSEDTLRLDVYLKSARLFLRRTQAQRQIESGFVLLNGAPTKPAHAVASGDRLVIRHPRVEIELEITVTPHGNVSKAAASGLYQVIRSTPLEDS